MPANLNQELLNPCLKEQELTYKCFSDFNYDKEKCTKQIENYKNCKSFWGAIKTQRRREGISPYLPPVEEREKIKQEYFASRKK